MQNHPLMILGTKEFLNRHADLVVSGAAIAPDDAREKVARFQPDVVVFELAITGPYDFTFLRKLRRKHPSLPILAYSYHEEVIFARRALAAGASGYLMKEADPGELTEALRHIVTGGFYLSDRVKERISREKAALKYGQGADLNGALVNSLDNSELQIFQFLGDGLPMAAIQEETHLTPTELTAAFRGMCKKLGLTSATELVQCALHWAYYEGDFS